MNRDTYISNLKEKIVTWENKLAMLQDDVSRSSGSEEEDYQEIIQDLFRQFETIQSRMDEFGQMSEEDFEEEKEVIDEEVEDFELSLQEARAEIKDI